jgi:WD40 repeat protein
MRILLAVMVATLACGSGQLGAEAPSATSPDGKRVAEATGKTVIVSEMQKIVMKIAGHTSPITALAYSPDGKMLVSADKTGKVSLLDSATGKLLRTLDTVAGANKLAFSADGGTLEVKSPTATKKYNPATGAEKP